MTHSGSDSTETTKPSGRRRGPKGVSALAEQLLALAAVGEMSKLLGDLLLVGNAVVERGEAGNLNDAMTLVFTEMSRAAERVRAVQQQERGS